MVKDTGSQRLDIWLYRTRLLKTRALAVKLIQSGKVRLTRSQYTQRITKPGYNVTIPDQISFMRGTTLIQVEVVSYPMRRGPVSEARKCYNLLATQTCDRADY